MRLDRDVRVQRARRLSRARDLGHAQPVGGVRDLALQVGQIDHIVVDQPDRADAGGGEVEQHRRAEAARPDDQHARGEQLRLAGAADLRQQDMARVALDLVFAKIHGV